MEKASWWRPACYIDRSYHVISRDSRVSGSGQTGNTPRRPPYTPTGSRSNSSTRIMTPKALVRTRSTTFDKAQPSRDNPHDSQSIRGSSKASTPGEGKLSAKGYFDDCDDGHTRVQRGTTTCGDGVTIHVNRPSTLYLRGRARSRDWKLVELSNAKFSRRPIRASSVGDLRQQDQRDRSDWEKKARPYVPETDLSGLTTCWRLESHLRQLRRVLCLYMNFDDLSNREYPTSLS